MSDKVHVNHKWIKSGISNNVDRINKIKLIKTQNPPSSNMEEFPQRNDASPFSEEKPSAVEISN